MDPSTQQILITTAGVLLSAIIAGAFAYFGTRNKARQTDLEVLQRENVELRARVKTLEIEVESQIREKAIINERKELLNSTVVELQKEVIAANKLSESLRKELQQATDLVNMLKNQSH